MQFQIMLWEFNCKSNKNIKSYHMLYENIVSDSIYVSKEILFEISPNQENEIALSVIL